MEGKLIIPATQESLTETSMPPEENLIIPAAQEPLLQHDTKGPETCNNLIQYDLF